MLEPDRHVTDDNIIRRLRIAYRITKTTNAHSPNM